MKHDDALPPDSTDMSAFQIMIVDDTPENLMLIKHMLSDRGFEVMAFTNGPAALRAAARVVPALVLLDITMPEMDGYEVCEHFKNDARLSHVPVIFLSALSDTDDKVKGFRKGAVDFITKPFQYEEVHARVMTHLKIHSLQQCLQYQNDNLQKLVEAKARQLSDAQLSLLVEQQRRADAVKESRQRLAEIAHLNRNTTATIYSAAIAHELNQPLAAIMSNAEAAELFLQMDPPALNEVKDILADIRRDDKRASDLIQQMRDLLKKSESQLQKMNVNDVVHDVVKFLAAEARMRHVTLTAQIGLDPLPVAADRIQLQQVMINLIINSMDAMAVTPENARTIAIRTMSIAPSHVEVAVADTGPGFDANISQVFESFFTTKTQGMGLGLSITSAIIQTHGGRIWAENASTGGAVVRFRLPLHQ